MIIPSNIYNSPTSQNFLFQFSHRGIQLLNFYNFFMMRVVQYFVLFLPQFFFSNTCFSNDGNDWYNKHDYESINVWFEIKAQPFKSLFTSLTLNYKFASHPPWKLFASIVCIVCFVAKGQPLWTRLGHPRPYYHLATLLFANR